MIAAARIAVAAGAVLGFAVIGPGTADATPADCVVTRNLVSATAQCHDTSAPARREYYLVVECVGLHIIPHAFPFMAIGPYRGSWSGSIKPSGQGTASCLNFIDIGYATNAYVAIYVD